MLYSKLFTKTSKVAPHDAESVNARLLIRGGFVDQLMAGVYSYLPLGLRVLDKIKNIIREEMKVLGAEELLMPALLPREPWEQTGRWQDPGPEVMFRVQGREGKEYGLGWTHEEIITPLAKKFISSYKDLPFAAYQIQDKFRNEPRAKSGLLRLREFSMKDLYSFHADERDLARFYEAVKKAYIKIFKRCGLEALITEASGGAFSKYSHEFQVLTPSGEDIIYYCEKCCYAQNREISTLHAGDDCPKCGKVKPSARARDKTPTPISRRESSVVGKIHEAKAVEVGNIFELKTRFSKSFNLTYKDESGKDQLTIMGCYGIGPSRILGTIVETHYDDRGIIWPEEVTPFGAQLLKIKNQKSKIKNKVDQIADKIHSDLIKQNVEVLYDDRDDVSPGKKFADADLIGSPWRIVVSERSLAAGGVEIKKRHEQKTKVVNPSKLHKLIK